MTIQDDLMQAIRSLPRVVFVQTASPLAAYEDALLAMGESGSVLGRRGPVFTLWNDPEHTEWVRRPEGLPRVQAPAGWCFVDEPYRQRQDWRVAYAPTDSALSQFVAAVSYDPRGQVCTFLVPSADISLRDERVQALLLQDMTRSVADARNIKVFVLFGEMAPPDVLLPNLKVIKAGPASEEHVRALLLHWEMQARCHGLSGFLEPYITQLTRYSDYQLQLAIGTALVCSRRRGEPMTAEQFLAALPFPAAHPLTPGQVPGDLN